MDKAQSSGTLKGQMKIRKHFTYRIHLESFNSDVVMVVSGQRIASFINDCLCGLKALTQYVFKVCS